MCLLNVTEDLLHTTCLSESQLPVMQQIIFHPESYHEQNTKLQKQTAVSTKAH